MVVILDQLSAPDIETYHNMLDTLPYRKLICGIHDTLAYMDVQVDCNGLVLSQEGQMYPCDYFESMHYDFICRCEGDSWPA